MAGAVRLCAAGVILGSFTLSGSVVAGSLSTSGKGARALAMGGAFTAVADDASAVYYNPAGITQAPGTEFMAGVAAGAPDIEYHARGAVQRNTRNWVAPWLFATHRLTDRLCAGVGVYSPFARDAEFDADPASGFPAQRASTFRLDLSPVIAYAVDPRLSLSAGLVIGYSEVDQSIPIDAVSRIEDTLDGWGLGGIVGVLYAPSEDLRLGATYRTRMTTDYEGERRLITPGPTLASAAESQGKWPATLGLGLATRPASRLTLSADAHWTGWSYVDEVVTRTATLGESTTVLDQRDTWDLRLGAEWEFRRDWFLRGGYSRVKRSLPTRWLSPTRPDGSGDGFAVGLGRAGRHWRTDLAYEFGVTGTLSAPDNAYGFTGDYQIDQHLVALTLTYH
jgi:long-chain fatty acid transport protein